MIGNRHVERHHLGVTRNALRENRLVIFGLCSIGLRRHGPFISCHIFLPLCFALSGTHLGSSFHKGKGWVKSWVLTGTREFFRNLSTWGCFHEGQNRSHSVLCRQKCLEQLACFGPVQKGSDPCGSSDGHSPVES